MSRNVAGMKQLGRNLKIRFQLALLLLATGLSAGLKSCKEDIPAFAIVSIVAGDVDIFDVGSPNAVPLSPVIVVTFNTQVDSATVIGNNISLIQDYDHSSVEVGLRAYGKTISITPSEDLIPGAAYSLTLGAGILSLDGQGLDEVVCNFLTSGTFVPKGIVAYWNFEDIVRDQVGVYNPEAGGVVEILFAASHNSAAGKAATFNGTTSIIEIPNGDMLINTSDFTISFWMKTNSADHPGPDGQPAGFCVIGLGSFYGLKFEINGGFTECVMTGRFDVGGGNSVAGDCSFNGDGKSYLNGGWQGYTFCKDLSNSGGISELLKDKWTHVTYTFEGNAVRVGRMYINGELVKAFDFNLWPEIDPIRNATALKYDGKVPETVNELAFGFSKSRAGTLLANEPAYGYEFSTSNHFKGQLDDLRIFHKSLTALEIQLMYNSEK